MCQIFFDINCIKNIKRFKNKIMALNKFKVYIKQIFKDYKVIYQIKCIATKVKTLLNNKENFIYYF